MKKSTLTAAFSLICFAAAAVSRTQDDPASPKLLHSVPDVASTLTLTGLCMAAVGALALGIAKAGTSKRR